VLPTVQPPLSASSVATATQLPAATPTAPTPYQPTRGTAIPSVSVPGSESAAPTPTGATLPSASPTSPSGQPEREEDNTNTDLLKNILSAIPVALISVLLRRFLQRGSLFTNLLVGELIVNASFIALNLIYKKNIDPQILADLSVITFIAILLWNFWRWYALLWLNRIKEGQLNDLPILNGHPEVSKEIIDERNSKSGIFNDFECIKECELNWNGKNMSIHKLFYDRLKHSTKENNRRCLIEEKNTFRDAIILDIDRPARSALIGRIKPTLKRNFIP
jgi:hypothetical protein